jgi:hypothetical protein
VKGEEISVMVVSHEGQGAMNKERYAETKPTQDCDEPQPDGRKDHSSDGYMDEKEDGKGIAWPTKEAKKKREEKHVNEYAYLDTESATRLTESGKKPENYL